MTPPAMAAWNLALRFGLELGALAGLGLAFALLVAFHYAASTSRIEWLAQA